MHCVFLQSTISIWESLHCNVLAKKIWLQLFIRSICTCIKLIFSHQKVTGSVHTATVRSKLQYAAQVLVATAEESSYFPPVKSVVHFYGRTTTTIKKDFFLQGLLGSNCHIYLCFCVWFAKNILCKLSGYMCAALTLLLWPKYLLTVFSEKKIPKERYSWR